MGYVGNAISFICTEFLPHARPCARPLYSHSGHQQTLPFLQAVNVRVLPHFLLPFIAHLSRAVLFSTSSPQPLLSLHPSQLLVPVPSPDDLSRSPVTCTLLNAAVSSQSHCTWLLGTLNTTNFSLLLKKWVLHFDSRMPHFPIVF